MKSSLELLKEYRGIVVETGIQFQPISEYPKTDDDGPELYLKDKDGRIYIGSWDSSSGYFFVTDIVRGEQPHNWELPGRMYNTPVEFAYKEVL